MAIGEPVERGAEDELLSFAPLDDGKGVEIVDHIERRHFTVQTPRPVSPAESSTDPFEFPVSRAFSIQTSELSIPNQLGTVVRNSLGFMVAEVTRDESRAFPEDTYSLDPGAPVKAYIQFDSPFTVSVSSEGIHIDLHSVTRVSFGIRSVHQRPAATVTIPDDARSLMKAVSLFGSALKTVTCERSYPTLRGHPPTIQLGESFDAPPILSTPDTGIRVKVPARHEHVYTVSSLAYYLGAEVVEGDDPKVITDTGFVHPLDSQARELEGEVDRVLKQVFFLDCLTRTEGLFQVNLHERNELEDTLNLNFDELYDRPLAEQLTAYLEVPYHLIEPHLPNWKLTALVTPNPANAEILPFLVNDLAQIKVAKEGFSSPSQTNEIDISDFFRSSQDPVAISTRSRVDSAPTPSLVRIEDSDSLEQTWIGDGAPMGASKGLIEGFQNRLGRAPTEHDIDITVICNAEEMNQESDVVNDVYGSRDELPFDVTVHRSLTAEELHHVLEEETDFLHYIGHIDAGGFECVDGRFDASSLDETGVDTFFLNACTSYEQGRELIRAGSIAGVVTLQDVINSGAERIGSTLAKLLNCGFPLQAAMNIARNESIMGGHYIVLGDGSMATTQPDGGNPTLYSINREGEKYSLRFQVLPVIEKGIGAIFTPHLNSCDEFHLVPSSSDPFLLSLDELREFISLDESPIRFENELTWSSEFLDDELGSAPR